MAEETTAAAEQTEQTTAATEPVADPYAELPEGEREVVKAWDSEWAKLTPAQRRQAYADLAAGQEARRKPAAPTKAVDPKPDATDDDEADADPVKLAKMTRKEIADLKAELAKRDEESKKEKSAESFKAELSSALGAHEYDDDDEKSTVRSAALATYFENNGTIPIAKCVKSAKDKIEAIAKKKNEKYLQGKRDAKATRSESGGRTPAGSTENIPKNPFKKGVDAFAKKWAQRVEETQNA